MLLAKGHIVYYGEASRAIEHFTSIGYPCPMHENPADFFIDLLTIDSTSPELTETSTERVERIIATSKINAGSMVARGDEEQARKRRLLVCRSTHIDCIWRAVADRRRLAGQAIDSTNQTAQANHQHRSRSVLVHASVLDLAANHTVHCAQPASHHLSLRTGSHRLGDGIALDANGQRPNHNQRSAVTAVLECCQCQLPGGVCMLEHLYVVADSQPTLQCTNRGC
jgi:hypothetical protein